MEIKIKNKAGIKLLTADTLCEEDIDVTLDSSLIPSGTLNINENGTHDVEQYAQVNVEIQSGIDTSDATATASDILLGKTAYVDGGKVEGNIETYDYSASEEVITDFDKFIMGELTEYYNDRVTIVSANIFEKNTIITSVSMPNLITLKSNSFGDCTNLIKINFPKLETIGATCFEYCTNLTEAEFLSVKSLGSGCFNGCGITYLSFPSMTNLDGRALNGAKVKTLHIPNVQSVGDYAFYHAHELTKIIIEQTDSVAQLVSATNAFRYAYHYLGEVNATYNPDGLKDGYIFVPDELLNDYKSATNWSTFADRFKPLSELEVE